MDFSNNIFEIIKKNNFPIYLTFFVILSSSFFFYVFSNGNIREITADFYLYYKPISRMQEINCNFVECLDQFNTFITNSDQREWIPSPIYSLFFLIPISLFNSDLLFLIQGIVITFLILIFLKKILNNFYKEIKNKRIVNWIILISFLNYPFLKDSLSCGAMSICVFLILISIYFYPINTLKSSFFICIAATIRPNFIYIIFSLFISLLIVKPKGYKRILLYSLLPAFISYLISYYFFFSSTPQTIVSNIFMTSFRNLDQFYEIVLPLLPVENTDELFKWNPNLLEVIKLLFTNSKLIYSAIIIYFMKIFHFLGYLGPDLLWDHRSIYIQRIPGLIYSLIILIPSFYFSIFFVFLNFLKNIRFFYKWDIVISLMSLTYIFIHSLYLGDPRYLIGIHFIYIMIYLRLINFFVDII